MRPKRPVLLLKRFRGRTLHSNEGMCACKLPFSNLARLGSVRLGSARFGSARRVVRMVTRRVRFGVVKPSRSRLVALWESRIVGCCVFCCVRAVHERLKTSEKSEGLIFARTRVYVCVCESVCVERQEGVEGAATQSYYLRRL